MTLLAAAFLAGLATLAVPLWLHRMSERAPAERDVSSLMLMRETEEPVRTRRTLAHKVLLALRLSALAAVTLAFAQPAIQALPFGSAHAEAPAKLIVLDGSFSRLSHAPWRSCGDSSPMAANPASYSPPTG
ncbi:MAG: BatA domain-containing protein [Pseudomonadales bacterium]|nr:BatA domain-containing protein [Pseudomonadales bacterium]